MKPTLIALLALCLCVVGCATLNDVGKHLWDADSNEGQSTDKGINQTSKVKIGTPIWEFETGGNVQSYPAIGSDGTVYFESRDKKLYAIKTDSKGLAKSPWPMFGQNAQHTGRAPKK